MSASKSNGPVINYIVPNTNLRLSAAATDDNEADLWLKNYIDAYNRRSLLFINTTLQQ